MKPRVRLMSLWQRTSSRGTPYFAGYLGGVGVVMFRDDQAELKPGCEAVWNLYIEERDVEDRRPAAAAHARRQPAKRSKPLKTESPSGRFPSSTEPLDDPLDDIGR